MKRLTIAAAVLAAFAQPAAAATIDQNSFFDAGGHPLLLSSIMTVPGQINRQQAQSVTAGKSGLLTRIDLLVAEQGGAGALVLGIGHGLVTDPGYANAISLTLDRTAIASHAELNSGGYTSVDLSALGFNVTAGQMFTIHIAAAPDSGTNRFGWALGNDIDGQGTLGTGITYAGGDNRLSDDGGASWMVSGLDRGFRTYVAGVPEPATWAMLIIGFGAIGLAARSRRPVTA